MTLPRDLADCGGAELPPHRCSGAAPPIEAMPALLARFNTRNGERAGHACERVRAIAGPPR